MADGVLQTARLTLRPIEVSDVELLWPATADPEISRYMAWEAHRDVDETRAFVEAEARRRDEGRGLTWVILEDEAFRGIVSLIGVIRHHRALTYHRGELAYWLVPEARGRGIATEAARRVLDYGFGDLGLHKIVVSHFRDNDASRRLIERLGFRYVGEQRQEYCKGGTWYDQLTYELLASDARR